MKLRKWMLLMLPALLLYVHHDAHAEGNPSLSHFIVNNNTKTPQYVFFSYKPSLGQREAVIFSLFPHTAQTLSYPSDSWDKYLQLLGNSREVKVTENHRYHLKYISLGRPHEAPYTIKDWGTFFITNDTTTPKSVQFRYSSSRYTIHLKPFESMPIPYSRHIMDTTLGLKTIRVLGCDSKKSIVHNRDHFRVSQLLLKDKTPCHIISN